MCPEVRTFAAVQLDDSVRRRAAAVMERLRQRCHGIAWVAPHQMHLTLHFYGDLAPTAIDTLLRALLDAVQPLPPFAITVEQLGTFPSGSRPRVVWLAVGDPTGGFARLHQAVEAATDRVGLPPEDRPFRPHLTIGRVKQRPDGLIEALAAEQSVSCGTCEVGKLVVYRSDLRPQGALYTPLAMLDLKGTPGR